MGGGQSKRAFCDYYVAMSGHAECVPPNYGWEAVGPKGMWPAPGLTLFDIELSAQKLSCPVIERVVPSPESATIYFECASPRVPAVCRHLDCWFEVEVLPHRDRQDAARRVIRCESSPAVFTGLSNGVEYHFVVKSCSILTATYSAPSAPVTPLKLPSKPRFTNIEATATELALYWDCAHFADRDVAATLLLRTSPTVPLPKGQGLRVNERGDIVLNDASSRCVRVQGLSTGKDYVVQLVASNAVGSMECEPESAAPCHPPPAVAIKAVVAGNREIVVDVDCSGWTEAATRCWFEVDVSPPIPSLDWLHSEIYASPKAKRLRKAMMAANPEDGHRRMQSLAANAQTLSRLQSAKQKQKWHGMGCSVNGDVLSRMDLLSSLSVDDGDGDGDDGHGDGHGDGDGDAVGDGDEVPLYRRQKRYHSLPMVIGPVINGEEYTVTVNARNYAGIRSSAPSDFVTPLGVPPQPTIRSVAAMDGEVRVAFECDDWSTLEQRARFEVVTTPQTARTKTRRMAAKLRNLENGRPYSLRVRGVNAIGRGPWSTESAAVKPLRGPDHVETARTVPGDGEVALFWVSDDVERAEYDGWFQVSSRPSSYLLVTKRQQCTMRRLRNGTAYRFRICAVNAVGKTTKFETESIAPRGTVTRKLYDDLRRKTALNLNQLRADHRRRKRERDRRRKSELGGDQRKKGKVLDAQRRFAVDHEHKDKGGGVEEEAEDGGGKRKESQRAKDRKKKRKQTRKAKGGGVGMDDFAAMIQKQQNKEQQRANRGSSSRRDKGQRIKEKEEILAKMRKTSIMDVSRVDNFGSIFRPKKM